MFKGFAVHKPGEELKLWEYEPQPLGANDVEIRVTHNGLCHTDLHMRDDDWGITSYPLIPGHEVVGVVEAVGANVTTAAKGDRVGFGWIRDSCRGCLPCLRGCENLCDKGYTGLIVGAGNFGGFQPRMRAPVSAPTEGGGALAGGNRGSCGECFVWFLQRGRVCAPPCHRLMT